jgi:hypothetical protein
MREHSEESVKFIVYKFLMVQIFENLKNAV